MQGEDTAQKKRMQPQSLAGKEACLGDPHWRTRISHLLGAIGLAATWPEDLLAALLMRATGSENSLLIQAA